MAKFGKIIGTGIIAAAAAAGTYYLVKNKDELLQRAKDFAEKISNNADDPDVDVEFDFCCDDDDFVTTGQEESEQEECVAEENAD